MTIIHYQNIDVPEEDRAAMCNYMISSNVADDIKSVTCKRCLKLIVINQTKGYMEKPRPLVSIPTLIWMGASIVLIILYLVGALHG
jgi:hypothetical protein